MRERIIQHSSAFRVGAAACLQFCSRALDTPLLLCFSASLLRAYSAHLPYIRPYMTDTVFSITTSAQRAYCPPANIQAM